MFSLRIKLLACFVCTSLVLRAGPVDFRLLREGVAVPLLVDAMEAAPVHRAAGDVACDIERVTGQRPEILRSTSRELPALIVAGQAGAGGAVDRLVAAGALDAAELSGQWESFIIEVVEGNALGAGEVLVVAGSDPRGTIYGLYQLAEDIGVSPWAWWADAPVRADPEAAVVPARRRYGPPSVKYRGIFINDEDWALHPWAAKTFDPSLGDIGPRTYAKVFELLLRLRGNYLWPAMHAVSRPFNEDGENARLAAEYGIVMGSSHAEPMLRNNVREWTAPHADYNYNTNREGVLAYWEERVESNGTYENVYTLGMRGIHDSGMQGGASTAERIELLERIIASQRELLRCHVDPQAENVPQVFVAYKEVLELYRAGLEVPDDVTIVWPDDNFGYIRDFASPDEQSERSGGFGVYYHISYLGRPMAYLWLNTTPPALIWEELTKAYAHGADRLWMLNVGDIKPAEIGMEFFFDLAWDVEGMPVEALDGYLVHWAAKTFGPVQAGRIASAMDAYYLLNFSRKPEHLQYYLPREEPRLSDLEDSEIEERLSAFRALASEIGALQEVIPAEAQDAFFQLVAYPALGSAAANERYFWTERYRRAPSVEAAAKAHTAAKRLADLTRTYNELGNGKWQHMMALEPADGDWKSMRIAELELPPKPATLDQIPARHPATSGAHAGPIQATLQASLPSATGAAWVAIPGLGRSGHAQTVLPFTASGWPPEDMPSLDYILNMPSAGKCRLVVEVLPTFPLAAGEPLRLALSVNDAETILIELPRETGSREWSIGVLQGYLSMSHTIHLNQGPNLIRLSAPTPGVAIDSVHAEDETEQ